MIVFDLECRTGAHRFEAWFAGSDSFADQQRRGLIVCPHCGSGDVVKAVMAPNVGRKGNQKPAAPPQAAAVAGGGGALPAEARAMLERVAALQAAALKDSRWVGAAFAEQSRKMHYGETDPALIHGQATAEEARELLDEGIAVMPLLVPALPPDELN